MKNAIIFITVFLVCNISFAQDDQEDKAKYYYDKIKSTVMEWYDLNREELYNYSAKYEKNEGPRLVISELAKDNFAIMRDAIEKSEVTETSMVVFYAEQLRYGIYLFINDKKKFEEYMEMINSCLILGSYILSEKE